MPDAAKSFTLHYDFEFEDGTKKEFDIAIDMLSLNIIKIEKESYPSWTLLKNFRCPHCRLDSKTKYCPVATNICDVVETFRSETSFQKTVVRVKTPERTYSKSTTLQDGLSAMMGVLMSTSTCPEFAYLKPMVRFHMPFGTIEETEYRVTSMYLLAQYFIRKRGGEPDLDMKKLIDLYENIRTVNINICRKLGEIQVKDANINALVSLDCFANTVSFSIESDRFEELEQLFKHYLI